MNFVVGDVYMVAFFKLELSPMSNDLVSIIVLAHNSKNHIQNCLRSISQQDYGNFELVIVDNASIDGTKQLLAGLNIERPKTVKVILNSSNLGYNSGNKVGIDNAKGDYIAIVNPDVNLEKSWLSNIMITMKNKPNVVASSGKLLNSNGDVQTTGGLLDIYGAVRQRKLNEVHLEKNFFYLSGAAFVFKRFVLDEIRFDPNLFMYYDDVDFAWQARLLDYEINYCENAQASHDVGHSFSGISPFKFYHTAKNRLYICIKNYSTNRIFRRIFKIIFLLFLDSMFYSYKRASPKYIAMFIKAIFWNMFNLNKLRKERSEIQKIRTITDKELEKFMCNKSIEFEMRNTLFS